MTISKKLLFIISIFFILTFGLASISYHLAKTHITNQIEDMGTIIVNEVSLLMDNYLRILFSASDLISISISNIYNENEFVDYKATLLLYFNELKNQGIETIYLGLENNYFVNVNNRLPYKNFNYKLQSWYMQAYNKQKLIITNPYEDIITHSNIINIAVPVFFKNKIIGVLGFDLNLNYLQHMLVNKTFLANGHSFLINKDGYFLVSALKQFTIYENIRMFSSQVDKQLANIGQHILDEKKGICDCIINNQDMLIFYSNVLDYFIFGLFFDKQSTHSLTKHILNQYIISGVFIIMCLLILLLPIIYDINYSFLLLSNKTYEIINKLKNSLCLEKSTYNIKELSNEILQITQQTTVFEFKVFLKNLYDILVLIANQNEEIIALTEETTAMQDELIITNKELEKRQKIWKSTLHIMDTITTKDESKKKIQNIVNTILENTKAFGVLLAEFDKDIFHLIAYAGYENNVQVRVGNVNSVAGQACLQQKSIWVEDVSLNAKYMLIHPHVVTELEIPLIYKGEAKGILEIAFDVKQKQNDELIDTLLPVAAAISSLLEIELRNEEIKESYKYLVQKLQYVTEIYHLESADHMDRISKYAVLLSRLLNKSVEQQNDIAVFSKLHDIGKLKVPLSILSKKGSLTKEEMNVVKQHPIWGADLIGYDAKWLKMARIICLTHHEKWDGSGYPKGLKEDEIPWEGQIVALADVYDSLRSERVYKKSIDHETTINIILRGDQRTKPTHFNPLLLELFKKYHYEFDKIFNNSVKTPSKDM